MKMRWEERAACAGTMLELWYGPDDYEEPADQARWRHCRARDFCATCPVWTHCLADELTRPLSEQHGIRGGLTPRARERLLARWRTAGLVPAHGPPTDVDFLHTLLTEVELFPIAQTDGTTRRA